VVQSRTEEDR
jgi:hypothetical protein